MVMSNDSPTSATKRIAALLAFGLVLGLGSTAFAQGDQGASADSSEASQQDEADEQQGPDPDDPDYWAKIREVQTVQKRSFQKVGRFAATAYAGIIPNNIFERYFPVGLRLNYFILENLGVEVAGSRTFQNRTPLRQVLREPSGINADTVKLADAQIWHTNVGLVWSPFYGKTAFYDNSIGYFDIYVFGGAGMAVTKTQADANQKYSDIEPTLKPEGVIGGGMAFYFQSNAAIRVDFRQFLFQKVEQAGGVATPSEISAGFGWFF